MAFRGQGPRHVREKLAGRSVVRGKKLVEKEKVHFGGETSRHPTSKPLNGQGLCGDNGLAKGMAVRTPFQILALEQDKRTDRQRIHLRSEKAVNRLCRVVYHRFLLVERRVQENGHSGDFAKSVDQFPIERIDVLLHGLKASRSIRMHDGRNAFPLVRLDLVGSYHERSGVAGLKVVASSLRENRWAEGAERFAELNAAVEGILHVLATRVRKDAAVSERTGAELHPALEPSHDIAVRNEPRGAVQKRGLIQFAVFDACRLEFGADFRIGILRPIVDVPHDERPRTAEHLMRNIKRGANGSAGIVGGGLDIYVLERRFLEELAIGRAIQRDTPGETDFLLAGLALNVAQEREIVFL